MLSLKMLISFSQLAIHWEKEDLKDLSFVVGISEGGHSRLGMDLVQDA